MTIYGAGILVCAFALAAAGLPGQPSTQGTLRARNRQGVVLADCPLKHTAVKADVSGMVARVNVVQEFQNPLTEKIEAVYVFPLPHIPDLFGASPVVVTGRYAGAARGTVKLSGGRRGVVRAGGIRDDPSIPGVRVGRVLTGIGLFRIAPGPA